MPANLEGSATGPSFFQPPSDTKSERSVRASQCGRFTDRQGERQQEMTRSD